jgi:hypothetical protein
MAKKPTPSPLVNKLAGKYDGAELKAYTGRPGAMDAFSKPSRIGHNFIEHRPPMGISSTVVSAGYAK